MNNLDFIFVTDLHGAKNGYNQILEIARDKKIGLVINGGDMLPKGDESLKRQKVFIKSFLNEHFRKFDEAGILYYAMFGNDDFASRIKYWREMIKLHPMVRDISVTQEIYCDTLFQGFNFVPDYPFPMKDWCALDYRGWGENRLRSKKAIISTDSGMEMIENEDAFFSKRPSIDEMLEKIPPHNGRRIFISHGPPSGCGLASILLPLPTGSGDVNKMDVGSVSVRKWIEKEQPFMSLHGHIHEIFEVEGKIMDRIGKTICIQPGQHIHQRSTLNELTYVIVRLRDEETTIEHNFVKV
jgi:Icc-related predicted phosphoesterase